MRSHAAKWVDAQHRWARPAALLGTSLAVALGLVLAPATAARADDNYYVPVTDELTLHGHGYGHGRGMSQHGARGAAMKGLSWRQIIDFYYPGTNLGQAGGRIKVLLTKAPASRNLTIDPARGLVVRDLSDGRQWRLPSGKGAWQLHVNRLNKVEVKYRENGRWHLYKLDGRGWYLDGQGEFQAAEPLTLHTPTGKHGYRERLRTAPAPGAGSKQRRTVNDVPLDKYVQGVIPYEMPSSWPTAAVRAQAVAARSYAVRHRNAGNKGWYDVDDTISYQVYGGADGEASAANDAVRATSGVVVKHRGSVALTEFSASSGGWSAGSSLPYQRVKPDPYDGVSGNQHHNWEQRVDVSALERRYPRIGDLERISVQTRNGGGQWGGRVERVVLFGSRGQETVYGNTLRSVWGLKSTWFAAEPTPIIRRWNRLGGPRSFLGDVRAAEQPVRGGALMRFENGRIYYSPASGAHELYGGILGFYRSLGGPDSALRLPSTNERSAGVGNARFVTFQRGGIYWAGRRQVHAVLAGINNAYHRLGGAVAIGLPITEEMSAGVPGGRMSKFQRGDIYWSSATGAHGVYGAIRNAYHRVGGARGIGLPVADEQSADVRGGRVSRFQGGHIYWSSRTGAHAVYGAILNAYRRDGGPAGGLGLPVSDEYAVAGGRQHDFQRGSIHWDRSTGRVRITED